MHNGSIPWQRSVILVIVGMLVLGSSVSCNKTIDMTTAIAPRKMVVDGQFDDWQGVPTRFFEDEGVVLGMCSDSERLYIHFRTRDRQWPN